MLNLVNITQARKNLSKLIDKVVEKQESVILIRESEPQVVLVPYKQYQKEEESWQKEFEKAAKNIRIHFKKYLKKKGIPYPKTEEEMYELADKLTGRH